MLDRGSFELVDARPGILPLDADLLNHFVGFERNPVNPEGEAERGKLRGPEACAREGAPVSGGLNELADGAPRRGGML